MSEHIAQRPSWDCRCCGKPWPCDPAREELAAELSPTLLRMHMWVRIEEAAAKIPGARAGELFERFLYWVR